MWFLFERFPLLLGAWDGLRYFIVALPEPSINYFDAFSFLEFRKRKSRSHGKGQKGNDKRKRSAAQESNTSLNYLSTKLREYG